MKGDRRASSSFFLLRKSQCSQRNRADKAEKSQAHEKGEQTGSFPVTEAERGFPPGTERGRTYVTGQLSQSEKQDGQRRQDRRQR